MARTLLVTPSSDSDTPQPARATRPVQRYRDALLLGLLLTGTLIKGFLWSQLIFPLDAPDEPSHFNYVMQVHSYHTLPQVFMPSPGYARPPSTPQDSATRAMLNHYGFTAFRGMPYESTQPPLYYAVAAALLAPLGEDRLMLMYAGRVASVLFGVGAVWALWLGVRALWPEVPLIVWGVPAALTLNPQFTFVTSTVTNDAAIILFGALIFAVWAAGLRASRKGEVVLWRWALAAGVVTGLGLLTKLTMIVTVPGTLLWLVWLVPGGVPVMKRALKALPPAILFGLAVLVLVGWWVVRNLLVYGEPTGTRAIFALYHGIYWTRHNFPPGQLFSAFPLDDFAVKTFTSFWAVYGWVAVMLPWWLYGLVLLASLVGLGGLVRLVLAKRRGRAISGAGAEPARGGMAWLSALTVVLAFANMLFYDSFVDYQPQARYVFVALAPAFLLLVLGLRNAASRPAVNRALVFALLGLLCLMQLASVQPLLDRSVAMAS